MMKRILVLMMVIGLISGLGAFGGMAAFTDQESTTDSSFGSGNVDLVLGTTTALVTYTNMKPGDSTGPQSLLVTNNGSLDLAYTMSTTMVTDTGTPLLGDELDLTIRAIDGTTPGTPCNDFDGALLYGNADLNDGAVASRVLTASNNETLCFRVDFPSASTAPMSATADATFVFDATQN